MSGIYAPYVANAVGSSVAGSIQADYAERAHQRDIWVQDVAARWKAGGVVEPHADASSGTEAVKAAAGEVTTVAERPIDVLDDKPFSRMLFGFFKGAAKLSVVSVPVLAAVQVGVTALHNSGLYRFEGAEPVLNGEPGLAGNLAVQMIPLTAACAAAAIAVHLQAVKRDEHRERDLALPGENIPEMAKRLESVPAGEVIMVRCISNETKYAAGVKLDNGDISWAPSVLIGNEAVKQMTDYLAREGVPVVKVRVDYKGTSADATAMRYVGGMLQGVTPDNPAVFRSAETAEGTRITRLLADGGQVFSSAPNAEHLVDAAPDRTGPRI